MSTSNSMILKKNRKNDILCRHKFKVENSQSKEVIGNTIFSNMKTWAVWLELYNLLRETIVNNSQVSITNMNKLDIWLAGFENVWIYCLSSSIWFGFHRQAGPGFSKLWTVSCKKFSLPRMIWNMGWDTNLYIYSYHHPLMLICADIFAGQVIKFK